jgi:hypothetical protein
MIYDTREILAVCRKKKSWAFKLSILSGLGVFSVQSKRKCKTKGNVKLKALDECISLSFPIDSPDELARLADEFGSQSKGAFQGCVGAMDGLLLKTRCPYKSEHRNPSAFKNRKCSYGILALAVADLRGKFLMFNVNNTGSTHDSVAWKTCTLEHRISNGDLPANLLLIGDEAFSCTNQTQSPWSGRGLGRFKDSYNFYLSSSRQCVERAFGILVKRWGVLQRKIICDFERWPLVAIVCAKLHNVCCDSNIPPPARWMDDVLPDDLPLVYLNDANDDIDPTEIIRTRAPNGFINRRESITSFLSNKGMGRPVNNSQSRA